MAKQLSTATTLLYFGLLQRRVDVLQSYFSRKTMSFAEFNMSTQINSDVLTLLAVV